MPEKNFQKILDYTHKGKRHFIVNRYIITEGETFVPGRSIVLITAIQFI